MRRRSLSLSLVALFAACAGEPEGFAPDSDEEQPLAGIACPSSGPFVCSGSGDVYASVLRAGASTTHLIESAQTFTVAQAGTPQGLVVKSRLLRPVPQGATERVRVAVRAVTGGVVPTTGTPLATASLPVSGLPRQRAADTTFTFDAGAATLQAGTTYALVFSVDAPATGSIAVGLGTFMTTAYVDGAAFVRAGPTGTQDAFDAQVGNLDLSFALTLGSSAPLFAETFDGLTGGTQDTTQYQSGLPLWFGRNHSGWSKGGTNAIHSVRWAAGNNDAVMLFSDNVLTQNTGVAANASGQTYGVSFFASPAVYGAPSQATSNDTVNDRILIDVLRGDNSTLATFTVHPGAWAGTMAFVNRSFTYVGDGSGNVRLRVRCLNANGRFCGAVDDLQVAAGG